MAVIPELAAQGDVVGLWARAQALMALDPKYRPFAQHVLDLTARFKLKAIAGHDLRSPFCLILMAAERARRQPVVAADFPAEGGSVFWFELAAR